MPLRPSPGFAPVAPTVRLPPDLYRRFRRYSLAREEAEARHVMHHEALVAAPAAPLTAHEVGASIRSDAWNGAASRTERPQSPVKE